MTKIKKGALWPICLTVFLVCFVSYLIAVIVATHKTNIDMVSPTIYEDELYYQDTIDAKKNALKLVQPVQILQDESQNIVISFPKNIDRDAVSGFVKLIRGDSAKGDLGFPLKLNTDSKYVIDRALLRKGHYKISVYWLYKNVDHLIETTLIIKASV